MFLQLKSTLRRASHALDMPIGPDCDGIQPTRLGEEPFIYLRNNKGFVWNHKRVYRIYRELELNLRIKLNRRIRRDRPDALSEPFAIDQVWSINFMNDSLDDDRRFRTFNMLADYNREGLGIEVDGSLSSERINRSLDQIIEWHRKPFALRCDNGPEYIS